jgi:ankyrin repeat protein
LIAFEEDQALEAATLLRAAGAGDMEGEEIKWPHPSIDLPGTFPRAAPLHHAIYCARDKVLETLLRLWPEHINHTGSKIEGRTPIEYAISLNRASAVEILIEHGALSDLEANKTCLSDVSVMENHELWARNGFCQETGEILAVKCIDAIARAAPSLLDIPEEFGFTPVMQAATNHRRDMVKCFINYGCNVNTTTSYENDGRTALNLLTENHLNNEENDIIDLLLKAGADLDHRTSKGGKHALHFAARDDKFWVARQLLDLGVGVGIVTPYGETPLHIAAYYGSPRVAKLLLDRGAHVHAVHRKGTYNLKNWHGLTPLAIASLRLRLDFINMLLDYGASALARPSTGHTVIHLAITEDNLDVLELLLQIPRLCTPEVLDAKDLVHGVTALHQCAGNLGKHAPLHLLIEAGADVNVLTDSGFSVLDFVYNTKEMILSNLKIISGK